MRFIGHSHSSHTRGAGENSLTGHRGHKREHLPETHLLNRATLILFFFFFTTETHRDAS